LNCGQSKRALLPDRFCVAGRAPQAMPALSVIITTHNRPHLLRRAVESVRAAGRDVEVVVVDDASADETAAVCRSLADIRYVRVALNQRVAGARNIGLLASSGEYVSFLDDDDRRLVDSLDIQLAALAAYPTAGMIYGQAIVADQQGTPTGRLYPADCLQDDIFWPLAQQNFIPCGSVIFRRACLYRVGLLDDDVPGLDDWDLWLRIAELYPVAAIAQPVVVWRQATPASAQGSSQAAALVTRARQKFLHDWMRLPRALDAAQATRREAWRRFATNMADHLVWEAARALACRQHGQALRNLSAALRLFPSASMRAPFRHAKLRVLFDQLRSERMARVQR
jgi:hypothetical protein